MLSQKITEFRRIFKFVREGIEDLYKESIDPEQVIEILYIVIASTRDIARYCLEDTPPPALVAQTQDSSSQIYLNLRSSPSSSLPMDNRNQGLDPSQSTQATTQATTQASSPPVYSNQGAIPRRSAASMHNRGQRLDQSQRFSSTTQASSPNVDSNQSAVSSSSVPMHNRDQRLDQSPSIQETTQASSPPVNYSNQGAIPKRSASRHFRDQGCPPMHSQAPPSVSLSISSSTSSATGVLILANSTPTPPGFSSPVYYGVGAAGSSSLPRYPPMHSQAPPSVSSISNATGGLILANSTPTPPGYPPMHSQAPPSVSSIPNATGGLIPANSTPTPPGYLTRRSLPAIPQGTLARLNRERSASDSQLDSDVPTQNTMSETSRGEREQASSTESSRSYFSYPIVLGKQRQFQSSSLSSDINRSSDPMAHLQMSRPVLSSATNRNLHATDPNPFSRVSQHTLPSVTNNNLIGLAPNLNLHQDFSNLSAHRSSSLNISQAHDSIENIDHQRRRNNLLNAGETPKKEDHNDDVLQWLNEIFISDSPTSDSPGGKIVEDRVVYSSEERSTNTLIQIFDNVNQQSLPTSPNIIPTTTNLFPTNGSHDSGNEISEDRIIEEATSAYSQPNDITSEELNLPSVIPSENVPKIIYSDLNAEAPPFEPKSQDLSRISQSVVTDSLNDIENNYLYEQDSPVWSIADLFNPSNNNQCLPVCDSGLNNQQFPAAERGFARGPPSDDNGNGQDQPQGLQANSEVSSSQMYSNQGAIPKRSVSRHNRDQGSDDIKDQDYQQFPIVNKFVATRSASDGLSTEHNQRFRGNHNRQADGINDEDYQQFPTVDRFVATRSASDGLSSEHNQRFRGNHNRQADDIKDQDYQQFPIVDRFVATESASDGLSNEHNQRFRGNHNRQGNDIDGQNNQQIPTVDRDFTTGLANDALNTERDQGYGDSGNWQDDSEHYFQTTRRTFGDFFVPSQPAIKKKKNKKKKKSRKMNSTDLKEDISERSNNSPSLSQGSSEADQIATSLRNLKLENNNLNASEQTQNSVSSSEMAQNSVSSSKQVYSSLSPIEQAQSSIPPSSGEEQSNASPSDQVQSRVSPSEEAQSNTSPSDQVQSSVSPSEEAQSNVSPSEQVRSNVSPSEQEQSSESPSKQTQSNVSLVDKIRRSRSRGR